jgi:hypothetical protein
MKRLVLFCLFVLLLAGGTQAAPLRCETASGISGDCPRDGFYCQAPDYGMIYNMSSGFDAEIADDIPEEWAGYRLDGVTLWVGEWYSIGGPTWRDPLGVRLNLYHESCPPEMVPFATQEVAWSEADKTLVLDDGAKTVYEVTIWLQEPVIVTSGMSIGATALIDWGQEEPFTGICATPMYTSYGACVMYLDAEFWGYYRWTAIDYYHGIPQDLGFCLHGFAAAVEEDETEVSAALSVYPNPFHARTTLRLRAASDGQVQLSVHDLTGRRVKTLTGTVDAAGESTFHWYGLDQAGCRLPAGVYLVRLVTEGGILTHRITLID